MIRISPSGRFLQCLFTVGVICILSTQLVVGQKIVAAPPPVWQHRGNQPELLQPMEGSETQVSLGNPEHAKTLIKEMGLKWEGMESPLALDNPWESVSSHGRQAGRNLGINGPISKIGAPDDPFTPKFGPYRHPPRGVPPVNYYKTLLFDSKHPFRRQMPENPNRDLTKSPDGLWHPFYGTTPRDDTKFPSVVMPLPRPMRALESNMRVPEGNKNWLYEPLPYRPHISRPERLPESRGVRPMSYQYPDFHLLNPRSAFQQPSRQLAQAQANAALGARFTTRHPEGKQDHMVSAQDGGIFDHDDRTYHFSTVHGQHHTSGGHGKGFDAPMLLEEGENLKQGLKNIDAKLHAHIMDKARAHRSRREEAQDRARQEQEAEEKDESEKEKETNKSSREFSFSEVFSKAEATTGSEHKNKGKAPWGFYPLGRHGPQLMHGPPTRKRGWDTLTYDEAQKRAGQRDLRDTTVGVASLEDRLKHGDPGPYGHWYNHQGGPPTEGRLPTAHVVSTAVPINIPEDEKTDGKMTDEPPLNDDNAIPEGPSAEGRPFVEPNGVKVDRIQVPSVMKQEDFPQFYKGVEEAEADGTDKPRVNEKQEVAEEKKEDAAAGDSTTVAASTGSNASGEAEHETNAASGEADHPAELIEQQSSVSMKAKHKDEVARHYLQKMVEQRRHKLVHPVFQETAAHIGKPKHRLTYDLPWTPSSVPKAHGHPPREQVSVELQVPSANLDVSLIEDMAQLTEDDFSKPWWERNSAVEANKRRLDRHLDGSPPLSDGVAKEAQDHPWKAMEHANKAMGKAPGFLETQSQKSSSIPLPNHDVALRGKKKAPSQAHPVLMHKRVASHKDGTVSWRFVEKQPEDGQTEQQQRVYDNAPMVPMASIVGGGVPHAASNAPNFLEASHNIGPAPMAGRPSAPPMRSPASQHALQTQSDLPPIVVEA